MRRRPPNEVTRFLEPRRHKIKLAEHLLFCTEDERHVALLLDGHPHCPQKRRIAEDVVKGCI